MTVGARIAKLRKALGLTQASFAKQIGITQQHVSQIEKGLREPSEQLLKHLHALYYTSMMWLTTGKGEMFISAEEIVSNVIARIGERAFYEAVRSIADEQALSLLAPRTDNKNVNPELEHMLAFLVDLWVLGDEDIKAWAKVQFARAFPPDIKEGIKKKWSEKQS